MLIKTYVPPKNLPVYLLYVVLFILADIDKISFKFGPNKDIAFNMILFNYARVCNFLISNHFFGFIKNMSNGD